MSEKVMHQKQIEAVSLETMLKNLEDVVKKMESQQLDLEESLLLFGRGVDLVKRCREVLLDAEQKVHLLSRSDEQDVLIDFKSEE